MPLHFLPFSSCCQCSGTGKTHTLSVLLRECARLALSTEEEAPEMSPDSSGKSVAFWPFGVAHANPYSHIKPYLDVYPWIFTI